jgi:hypothetical protein
LPAPEQQILKRRSAEFINARDFTIQNGSLDSKMLGKPVSHVRKAGKGIPIARYQFSTAMFDIAQCPKAANFQFINEMFRIERFGAAGKPDGA